MSATKVREPGIVQELGVKVGDIFVESWGYDQTNINFYEVVDVTRSSVRIVEIQKSRVEGTGYSDKVVPLPGVVKTRGRLAGYNEPDPTPQAQGPAGLPG